jgi:serine O-acetyltransferase
METRSTLDLWTTLARQVRQAAQDEPVLSRCFELFVLRHECLEQSLATILGTKLATAWIDADTLTNACAGALSDSPSLVQAVARDLLAAMERDPASHGVAHVYLNHKGFQALQVYRLSHWFWTRQRHSLSYFLQSRASEVFAVDIHPGARIGSGLFIDHGTGVVVGETAVIGENVSLLQEVTLGGTGKEIGDRHPKVGNGVLICAGAKVLGNIRIGEGSKIGAGSVVLSDVAPHTTVVGVPARPVGHPSVPNPALVMDQRIEVDTDPSEDSESRVEPSKQRSREQAKR